MTNITLWQIGSSASEVAENMKERRSQYKYSKHGNKNFKTQNWEDRTE